MERFITRQFEIAVYLALVCVLLTSVRLAYANDVRVYELLADDEFNYFSDCGECSLTFGTQARTSGRFTVSLDRSNGTGVIESLDIWLTDVETLTAQIDGPLEWLPQPDRPFLGPSDYFDDFRPPLTGSLQTMGDALLLSSPPPAPADDQVAIMPRRTSFELRMQGNEAKLSVSLLIFETLPRIQNVKAILVEQVPEPNSFAMIAIGVLGSLRAIRCQAPGTTG